MLNRSARRRLRQAVNRANEAIGRVDRSNSAGDTENDRRDYETRVLHSVDEPKNGAHQPTGSAQPTQSQDPSHFEKRIANATVAMALLTTGLFLVGIASAVIANRTVDVISGQLEEMKAGSEQTNKLIASNADLAAAARAQSLAEQESATTANASLLMNQRARIGSIAAKLEPLQIGQGARASISYFNVGHESAPIDPDMYLRKWSKDDWYTDKFRRILSKQAENCLAVYSINPTAVSDPSTPYTISADSNDEGAPIDSKFAIDDGVINGDSVIVVGICLSYKTMGEMHHTASCYYYLANKSPNVDTLSVCEAGNASD
jgi:hypothetical protein